MTRWFATDRDGFMAVFESGEAGAVPHALANPDLGATMTITVSRELRRTHLPVRGAHARLRAGSVLMFADVKTVRSYAHRAEQVMPGAVRAYFPRPLRGRAATFMPGVRTFGSGGDLPSALELLHMQKTICAGCMPERVGDTLDEDRLADLGFYVYICDGAAVAEPYRRARVPAEPLHSSRIGRYARRFAKFPGVFATHDAVQPIEHWKKVSVEAAAWLGSDGTVRCVRGRTSEYAKEYKLLIDEYTSVEPPRQ